MSPSGGGKATGPIAAEINSYFGSFDAFKKHFSAAAEKKSRDGWAMLVWSPRSRHLEILQVEKHQNLSQQDIIPLLVLDVWEHSYYLKYHSDRKKNISRPGGMWSTGRMSTNASAPPKKCRMGSLLNCGNSKLQKNRRLEKRFFSSRRLRLLSLNQGKKLRSQCGVLAEKPSHRRGDGCAARLLHTSRAHA